MDQLLSILAGWRSNKKNPFAKESMKLTPLSIIEARRLAVAAQMLAAPRLKPDLESMKTILRRLRCLQLDPIRAVERTQYLVLWSRLGAYDPALLHRLSDERFLFEYWAHAASLVLTEDFPLHRELMARYGQTFGSASSRRLHAWVLENQALKAYILEELEKKGPLLTQDFDDRANITWESGGWSSGRSTVYMLDYLWTRGEILVDKRDGLKRWWNLADRVLPAPYRLNGQATRLTSREITYEAAQKALLALGIGREKDIRNHFIENRYPYLKETLRRLQDEGRIFPVTVADDAWGPGWYIHADHQATLDAIRSGRFEGRTTLLSPFDNLIRNRDRTELMWDFFYRIEIYVPKNQREYGYYVLPILHHDRLIGRIDPRMDRKKQELAVNAIYLEADAEAIPGAAEAVRAALADLGRFLGAARIVYGDNIPAAWQPWPAVQSLA